MKAKACTRCRQWKARCDANETGTKGCTRCRESRLECVFDRGFRRQSRNRKIADMQAEIDGLKEAIVNASPYQSQAPALTPCVAITPSDSYSASRVLDGDAVVEPVIDNDAAVMGEPSPIATQGCVKDKSIGTIHLTASHVDELFRIYFARCHPYLPFNIDRSVEVTYERSALLFWAICTVASPDSAKSTFETPIRSLMADTLDPSKHSLEMVQALLIVCMWPFPFIDQRTDPSYVYSGIATHIGLGLGLHRPLVVDFGLEAGDSHHTEEMRTSTWLACVVIAQIQASRRGVPATISTDCFHFLASDSEMSRLYEISRLALESNQNIGATGKDAGLVEPSARISLIVAFGKQFDALKERDGAVGSDIFEIFFFSATLQLWAFALHTDTPTSPAVTRILTRAKEDAVRLIQTLCEKNLSLVPFYIRKSLFYAALFLYRLKLTHGWSGSVIDHHIERAKQALSSTEHPNFGRYLGFITQAEHAEVFRSAFTTADSPYRSRMAAFLAFDCKRAYIDVQLAELLCSGPLLDFSDIPWTEF